MRLPAASATSSGVPVATTEPPARPAPGPRSMTQSASATTRMSCSTTITVLPASTDVRNADLVDQPPRIRGDRLEVAALRLRIKRAEGERTLPRSGDAGEGDEGVARHVDVDAPEVVLAGPAHADAVVGVGGSWRAHPSSLPCPNVGGPGLLRRVRTTRCAPRHRRGGGASAKRRRLGRSREHRRTSRAPHPTPRRTRRKGIRTSPAPRSGTPTAGSAPHSKDAQPERGVDDQDGKKLPRQPWGSHDLHHDVNRDDGSQHESGEEGRGHPSVGSHWQLNPVGPARG